MPENARDPRPPTRSSLTDGVDRVAPRLLGMLVVGRGVVVRVAEVEAYDQDDPASHTHGGRTPRNATMFGPAGHLYVYLSHGLHHCANVVVGPVGSGAAVLLRAGDVVEGRSRALQRRQGRGAEDPRTLAGGPGRLGAALGLTVDDDGHDLLGRAGPRLLDDGHRPAGVGTGPRVGVRRAADRARRWWDEQSHAVSRYRRHPRADPPGHG